jgi:HemY protein
MAALAAQLWGEARRHLDQLAELERASGEPGEISQSTARLYARLEEGERGNMTAARDWLEKAAVLPPDPVWLCDKCGAPGEAGPQCGHWQAVCPHCEAIDSLVWKRPALAEMGILAAPGGPLSDPAAVAIAAPGAPNSPAGEANQPSAAPSAGPSAGTSAAPSGASDSEAAPVGSSVDAARLVN